MNNTMENSDIYTLRADLEMFLEQRPQREQLVCSNILKESSVAPALIQTTEKIMWEKKTKSLQKKIYKRPEIGYLREKGIMDGMWIVIDLIFLLEDENKKQSYKQVADKLATKVSKRPNVDVLVERGIMPMSKASLLRTSPAIQQVLLHLDKTLQKEWLEQHLSKRPKPNEVNAKFGCIVDVSPDSSDYDDSSWHSAL